MNDQYITIDGIKWWVSTNTSGVRTPQPLCSIHDLRLRPIKDILSTQYDYLLNSYTLTCEDCRTPHKIPRTFQKEAQYVIDKIDSKLFKRMKFINLDDEALPIAEHKIAKNSEYFVTSLLTKSKVGLRLVVYAGKKGANQKTQIFVEPDIKRLAFDQTNLHPTDIFTKLEATFSDGTKIIMSKDKAK